VSLIQVSITKEHSSHLVGNEQICGHSPDDPKSSYRAMVDLDLYVLVNSQAIAWEEQPCTYQGLLQEASPRKRHSAHLQACSQYRSSHI
jgi:hypothetical protein